MKDNSLKVFLRQTYSSRSPVPFILTIQVLVFVVLHIFDLIVEVGWVDTPLYDNMLSQLNLSPSFARLLDKPWSLVSYVFLHTGLFQLLFASLWLFWMGKLFLSYLQNRQFLFLFFSATLLGALIFLALSQVPFLQQNPQSNLFTSNMALGALMGFISVLIPKQQIRLFLLGNLTIRTIAYLYIGLQTFFYFMINKPAAIAFLLVSLYGYLSCRALQNGNDFSMLFRFKLKNKRRKLKVVHVNPHAVKYPTPDARFPNQEEIDRILDKISQSGIKSLTKTEKQTLHRASKKEDLE